MKQILFLILIFLTPNLFGQKLTDKVGGIEVQLIGHHFKRNSDTDLTKRKTNRKSQPYLKMYFDSAGILLKSISFGKQHNTDLRLIDKINVFEYANGKLSKSIEYESDYEKNIYPYWESKYLYNEKGELTDESTYYYGTDSLFLRTAYEYDLSSNRVKSISNPAYYYQREFDSLNRIIILSQISDNKLRWDWNYKYSGSQRVGVFQTYYGDGEDYSKKEIRTYNSQGLLSETKEIHASEGRFNKKTKIYYYDNGIIRRVEYFKSSSFQDGYDLVSYYDVKIKGKIKVDSQLAERINEQIDVQ